ncbi:hypothetical protein SCALM49S_07938 [Streptomyces californicus]
MAAFGGGTGSNQASYQVTLKDAADYEDAQDRIDEALGKLDGIGDTTIAAGDGFGSQDLSVVVKAADADVLRRRPRPSAPMVATVKDVTDVQSDLAQSVPRISVTANDKAAAAGFDSAALGGIVAWSRTRDARRLRDAGRHRARHRHPLREAGRHHGRAEGPAARPGQARRHRRREGGPRPWSP